MKKFYLLLTLCLMGLVSASAKDYFTLEGLSATEDYPAVDKIEAGVGYFIGNARTNAQTYLCPTGGTTVLSSSCIYEFVEAGKDREGTTTYILKNVESGEYLSTGVTGYTASLSRAQQFTVMPAQVFHAELNENNKYSVDWENESYDPRNATADYDTNGNFILADPFADGSKVCWVICIANSVNKEEGSADYLSTYGGANIMSYRDTNCWAIYKPAKLTGNEAMEPAFQDILGGEEFDPDTYTIGTGPGEYGEAEVGAFAEAYETFFNLLMYGGSDEECDAAIAALAEAWEALQASMGTLNDGQYYRFWNWRDNGSYTGCMYDDGSNVKWTNNYTAPEELDVDGTKYVWKLVKIEGKNYFQNYYTGRYMSDVAGYSQAFPTTTEPATSFVISATDEAGAFNIRGEQRAETYGMHTQVNGYVVVYWNAGSSTNNQGSLWKVETLDPQVIQALEQELEQVRKNQELKELLAAAQTTYAKGFSYDQYLTSVDQIIANRTEQSEGAKEPGLVDGNPTTYYHSFWSEQGNEGQPHWFQVEMEEAVSEFVFDVTRRGINTNKNGAVTRWVVVGTNDSSLAEGDDYVDGDFRATLDTYKDSWEAYTEVIGEYDQTVTWNGASYANAMASFAVKFEQPVKFVRFLAAGRMTDTYATEEQIEEEGYDPFLPVAYADKPASNIYMCIGELSIHSAEVNPELSVINAVPAEVRNAFETAMATAEAELAENAATDATIAALEAAYEEFLKNFPEPQVLRDLIEEAQGWVDEAPIGEEVGYFPEGATDELAALLETIEVKDVMSMQEITAGKTAILEAIDALNAKLHMPEPGLYYIKSTTTPDARPYDNYVGLNKSGNAQLTWGAADGGAESRPGYYWMLTKNEDNTWTLYNCGTGYYLNADSVSEDGPLYACAEPTKFQLRSARNGGSFNLVFGEGIYMNAQPTTGNVVTWGAARGEDNSSFAFEDAEEEWTGDYTIDYEAGEPQIITLPYDIEATSIEPLYKLVGTYQGAYQFDYYEEGAIIPAGTPFLYYSEDENESTDFVTVKAEDITTISFVTEAKAQSGMIGTLEAIEELEIGSGIFWNGKIVGSEKGEGVEANTGYFALCEDCGREGELSIYFDGVTVEAGTVGISNAVVSHKANRAIFNLQGQKINGKLSSGLYIINNKKVVVK